MKTYHLHELESLVGSDLGDSDWITVTQERINQFAQATGDHQWIHVDPERAASGPFGRTIGHGFLTLSLVPALSASAMQFADAKMSINYGLNRVRFTAPVPVDSRVRGRLKLLAYEPIEGGAQLTVEVRIEREGSDKPVCIAETLSRRYT
jgi:acyl dehydratase